MVSRRLGIRRIEDRLNDLVARFGLKYRVVVSFPGPGNKLGEVDEKNKIIYVYSVDEDEAYKILLHEIIEIHLKPVINKYTRLINKLLEYIQEELYIEKEKFINKMGDLLK